MSIQKIYLILNATGNTATTFIVGLQLIRFLIFSAIVQPQLITKMPN